MDPILFEDKILEMYARNAAASRSEDGPEETPKEYLRERIHKISKATAASVPKKDCQEKVEKRLYPDTWEMKFWNKCFGWLLFGDHRVGSAIRFMFVAPLTNVTCLSLYYQLYLNEIFHTHFMTRISHFLFMPIINFFFMVFMCQFYFSEEYKWLNAGTATSIFFALWYLVWGITQNAALLGVFMAPALAILSFFANLYYLFFKHDDGALHNFYDPTSFYSNPLLWILILGMLQSASHICEPKLPPRVNHTQDQWMEIPVFVKKGFSKKEYLITILTLVAAFLCGTIDEIIASPRLFPLNVLKVTYMLGYKPEQWEEIQELAKKSLENGNPAVDYIGFL